MMERSPLQYLSKTFTYLSKVTLPNIRKGLVKVTFPSHLQYLNGSLSKSLRSLKVYFRAVRLRMNLGPLRIDKGSPGGALYLGTCIRNYDNCQGILYIVRKIILFSTY